MNYFVDAIVMTWWFWVVLLAWLGFIVWAFFFDDWWDGFEKAFLSFFAVPLAISFVWPAGAGLANLVLPHRDLTSRHDIVVLNDQSAPSGRFVMGSGTIDNQPAFSFYTQEDGYNQFVVLRGPNARVYQDLKPGETPWAVTFNDCRLWGALATCFSNGRVVNEIHVPPNSIKPSLELDAR